MKYSWQIFWVSFSVVFIISLLLRSPFSSRRKFNDMKTINRIIQNRYIVSLNSICKDLWSRFLSLLRSNAIILVLLLLYLSFYHFWETIIRDHIIDTLLCHYESNCVNDCIFFIIAGFCVCNIFFNLRKKNKLQTIILSIIFACLWAYYRFFCDECGKNDSLFYIYLTPISVYEQIKYFDIVAIYVVCKFISFLLNRFFSISSKDKNAFTDGFIQDNPIDNKEDDILGRKQQAAAAVDLLFRTDTMNGSFTMGINAPWGAGKTSFMNLMKEEIHSKPEKCLILDFNPWLYASEKDLVTIFFDELSKCLKSYDLSLAKYIIDYSALLSAFDIQETKMAASIINLNRTESSLQDKKTQIAESIKRIHKQIFVFIDDLDRLDADELLEMMKLIRNISDFPYMYYIAAYDKTYLVECLEKRMKTKEIDFTEKIFQVELLPLEGPRINLHIELFRMLNKYITKSDKRDFDIFLNWCRDSYIFTNVVSNIREVKRLANSFLISYDYLKHKINVNDLLLLELLRLKFPLAFSYFAQNRAKFFDNDVHYKYFIVLDDGVSSIFGNNLRLRKDELRIKETDISDIESIVGILFPSHGQEIYETSKSICEVDYFENYFVPIDSERAISHNEFMNLMKSGNLESIQDMIARWSHYNGLSLRRRLQVYRPSNREELIILIKVLFFTLFIKLDGISSQEITARIMDLRKFGNGEYSSSDKNFLHEVLLDKYDIQVCQYLYFLCYNYNQYRGFPLTKSDLNSIRIRLFQKCINTYRYNFKELISCFIFMIDRDYWNRTADESHNISIQHIMKNHAENNINAFIPAIITQDNAQNAESDNNKFYYINRIPALIWGSLDKFQNSLVRHESDDPDPIISELNRFINDYKNNGFKSTNFPFQHIKPLSLRFQDFFYLEHGKVRNSLLFGISGFDIWEYVLGPETTREGDSPFSKSEEYNFHKQLIFLDAKLKHLGTREPDLKTDSEATASIYDEIGRIYLYQDDFQNALESCNSALIIRQRVFGNKSKAIAQSYDNIGSIYYDQGFKHKDELMSYQKALSYYQKAYKILEELENPDSLKQWVFFHIQITEEKIKKLE